MRTTAASASGNGAAVVGTDRGCAADASDGGRAAGEAEGLAEGAEGIVRGGDFVGGRGWDGAWKGGGGASGVGVGVGVVDEVEGWRDGTREGVGGFLGGSGAVSADHACGDADGCAAEDVVLRDVSEGDEERIEWMKNRGMQRR